MRNRALELLFPNRKVADPRPASALQNALAMGLNVLLETPEAIGILQFLPAFRSAVRSMPDEEIRRGREMMRELVRTLDEADQPETDTSETRSTSDRRGSNGNGKNHSYEGVDPPVQEGHHH